MTASQVGAHAGIVFLLELERQGTKVITAADAAAHIVALNETLFEAAHLIDARFYDYLPSAARKLMEWDSADDLSAVLATASEHRRSWPRYFTAQTGAGSLPEDLNELKSITETFIGLLVKCDAEGKPLPGVPTPREGWKPIKPGMTATEIVQLHLDVWTKRFGPPGGVASRQAIATLQQILTQLNGL